MRLLNDDDDDDGSIDVEVADKNGTVGVNDQVQVPGAERKVQSKYPKAFAQGGRGGGSVHKEKLNSSQRKQTREVGHFEKGVGTSCQNYVRNDAKGRMLAESKDMCLNDTECNAVVCPTGKNTGCTLRAIANMVPYVDEDCYKKISYDDLEIEIGQVGDLEAWQAQVAAIEAVGGIHDAAGRIVGAGAFTHTAKKIALPHTDRPEPLGADGCSAKRRLIYIKTHKTGSSSLANIFHRYAFGHGCNIVLPKNALFLGWPNGGMLKSSYTPIPDVENTEKMYDMFISAHTRYNPPVLEPMLPGADHVTVLREPASHFVSSWNYWGVPEHIRAKSGDKKFTIDDVLADPPTWWKKGLRSDRDLLENSMAFDLGLDKTASVDEVDELISRMDTWALVMITEYMDESLVILKRRMCWSIEDVVYYALKVNHGKKKVIPPERAAKIRQLNWMDTKLYAHFNASLWKNIESAEGFAEDLVELRRLKTKWAKDCQNFAMLDVDGHRARMLGESGMISEAEMRCHLMQIDSEGFVKYLKQWSGIRHLECHRQGRPLKSAVFVPIADTGYVKFLPTMNRYTIRERLRPALPLPGKRNYGYPHFDKLPEDVVALSRTQMHLGQPGPGRKKDQHDVMGFVPFRFNFDSVRKVVGGALEQPASLTTLLRHPVEHFWGLWHDPDVTRVRLAAWGPSVTIEQFLAAPTPYLEGLPSSLAIRFQNGQSYALGLPAGTKKEDTSAVESLVSQVRTRFSHVLIEEYFDEALVLFRRVECWPAEEINHPVAPPQTEGRSQMSAALQASVMQFNFADSALYTAMNASMWSTIARMEINFMVEVEEMRKARAASGTECVAVVGMSDEDRLEAMRAMVKVAQPNGPTKAANLLDNNKIFQCHTQSLGPQAFVQLLRTIWHMKGDADPIPPPPKFDITQIAASRAKQQTPLLGDQVSPDDLAAQVAGAVYSNGGDGGMCSPTKKFIYLKTHKTGSSTMLSILHRFAFKNKLNSALPIDNMYLGWPTRRGALNSYTAIRGVNDYDVFCSGHSTWSKNYLREIVPIGKQITIFREPVAQFVSSWNYWHPYEHILSMGGPKVSMSKFLDEPTKYWKYAKWSDEALLHNSYAYDFGITSQPTQEQVDGIVEDLKIEFDLVLITEWFDESLVMMKRIFCWDIEDIVHFALKVTKRSAHHAAASPEDTTKIMALNYADIKIYAAMNKTFHEKLAVHQKDPDFHHDLATLQQSREEVGEMCKKVVHLAEDEHRQIIALGKDANGCSMYLLDSKGFVKMLKRNVGIQTSECRTVSVFPTKTMAFLPPRWIAASKPVTNMVYRAAIKTGYHSNNKIVVPPKDFNSDKNWDNPEVLKLWNQGSMMAESFTRYLMSSQKAVVPTDYLITMLQDPATHFMAAWDWCRKNFGYGEVDADDFFKSPAKYPEAMELMKNPQTYDLVGTRDPSKSNIEPLVHGLERTFRYVLIAERLLESMVLLRREVCFDRKDNVYIDAMEFGASKGSVAEEPSKKLRKKIYQFNAVDARLYTFHETRLNKRLLEEIYFQEEVDELAAWNKEAATVCARYASDPQTVHKEWMFGHPKSAFKKIKFVDKGGQSFPEDNSLKPREKDCRSLLASAETYRAIVQQHARAARRTS